MCLAGAVNISKARNIHLMVAEVERVTLRATYFMNSGAFKPVEVETHMEALLAPLIVFTNWLYSFF